MEKPNFKATSDVVRGILAVYPKTRNSDELLYVKVCEKINPETLRLSLPYVFYNRAELGLPKFETVRRTRQRLQAKFPELAADLEIRQARAELENDYREFAKE